MLTSVCLNIGLDVILITSLSSQRSAFFRAWIHSEKSPVHQDDVVKPSVFWIWYQCSVVAVCTLADMSCVSSINGDISISLPHWVLVTEELTQASSNFDGLKSIKIKFIGMRAGYR